MKITQSRFYRPNGEAIEEVGVKPDILAESEDKEMPPWDGPDLLLDRATKALGNN